MRNNKRKTNYFISLFLLVIALFSVFNPSQKTIVIKDKVFTSNALENKENNITSNSENKTATYKMAIVIDDFGSYDQSGVDLLLQCPASLTCAVLPNVDNTEKNIFDFSNLGHEIILHMPMASHVNLPADWYGPVYIGLSDSPKTVTEKLESCLKQFDNIKGFNIHIGSGVSRNKELMKVIYSFAKEHNLYFLDSRTIVTSATEDACKETGLVYLGRDVFLEADKNRSYAGVCSRLIEGANIAKEKGYSIVIGHVGAEGGENTAKAIIDTLPKLSEMGIEIVHLSEIYEGIKNETLKAKLS